jgi:hypothetical protein
MVFFTFSTDVINISPGMGAIWSFMSLFPTVVAFWNGSFLRVVLFFILNLFGFLSFWDIIRGFIFEFPIHACHFHYFFNGSYQVRQICI